MSEALSLKEISSKVEDLRKLAQEIYDGSDDIPAVNRNVKRILASIHMLTLNVEAVPD
jgi:hypothetical protein